MKASGKRAMFFGCSYGPSTYQCLALIDTQYEETNKKYRRKNVSNRQISLFVQYEENGYFSLNGYKFCHWNFRVSTRLSLNTSLKVC